MIESKETHKSCTLLHTGSTVAVQMENGSLWTYGKVMGHGSEDHSDRSYKMRVTKMGCIITRAL